MSINLTDELLAKTKKGKIASAKQVFLEGDKENLQQIGDKTHQLEDAIKDITVSGGASTANAVSYNNETSGMTAVTAQGAIDELAAKNATKAEKTEVTAEFEKKFDKESILQESGNAEDKVMSQKAVSNKLSDLCNSVDMIFPKGATANLLLQDALIKNYWYNTSGIKTYIVDDSNPWYILPLIKVEPSTVYTTRGISIIAYYNENKEFVSYESVSSWYNIQHTTPSNAAYVGITTRENFLNICGYYKGDYSGEKIFGEKLILESQIAGNLSIEKIEGLSTAIGKGLKTVALINTSNYNNLLPSANDALNNSIYELNFDYGTKEMTANLPVSQNYGSMDLLITIVDTYKVQFYISSIHGRWKRIFANQWTDWQRTDNVTLERVIGISEEFTKRDNAIKEVKDSADAAESQIERIYDSLDAESLDKVYPKEKTENLLIQSALQKGYWYNVSNGKKTPVTDNDAFYILPLIPVEAGAEYTTRGVSLLSFYDANKTYKTYKNVVSMYNIQHTMPEGTAFVGITTRQSLLEICGFYKGTYSGEKIIGENLLATNQIKGLSNTISKSLKTIATVTTSNYGTILSSANDAADNSIYVLNFNYGSTDITGDLPYSQFYGQLDMLVTIKDTYKVQFYYGKFHGTWRRTYINPTIGWKDWERIGFVDAPNNTKEYVRSGGEWKEIKVPSTFIVSKDGSGNYTSLTKAVMENVGKGAKIYVRGGTYDLIEEIKDYYGADYFDNPEFKHEGLIINDTEIYMDSNVFVKFIYDGANQSVVDWFSPFKFSGIGGVLKGGNIECTNCRYAIHDDTYPSSQHDSRLIDGVNIKYTSNRNTIIGGGLGQASHVEVRNCHCVNTSSAGYGIWYHNASYGDNAKSTIRIHDNYCNTTILVQPMGVSKQITTAIICNNKCQHVGKVGTYDIDNIELIEFNNQTDNV